MAIPNNASRLAKYRLAPAARMSALDLIRDSEAERAALTDDLEGALWRRIGSRLPESVRREVESAVRAELPALRELAAESARVQRLPLERLRVQVAEEQQRAEGRVSLTLERELSDRLPRLVEEALLREPVVIHTLNQGLNEQEARLAALRAEVRADGQRARQEALETLRRTVLDELPGLVAETLPLILLQEPGVPGSGPPGALEAVGLLYPFGETGFSYLRRQIANLDVGFGELTGGNTWTGAQVFEDDVTVNANLDLNGNGDISGTLDLGGNLLADSTVFATGGFVAGDQAGQDALVDIDRAAVINNPSQGQFTSLRVQPPADTGVTASVDPMDVYLALNRTVTFAAGHAGGTNLHAVNIEGPTYAGATAVTFPEAATVLINGAPIAGANVTLTESYALFVNGLARFDQAAGAHVFRFDADATDPTGGGGAAAGRIPVLIGGATRYLAYY